ncbi:hypothetical protein R5W23_003010 [Gemmata sp. JC673]|uniref:Uncharacterized protein n=1 Tax=Gemmata algarum TaxID=2975278 RepID=A0ABU5ETE5_9BACT|nr:hypothetical protein [Gemmata algarum]MDY3557745.1 hypothetical protein [Gemmata algarum]
MAALDGAQGTFPLAATIPNLGGFVLAEKKDNIPWWLPTTVVPGFPGMAQNIYNKKVIALGQKGLKKGANALVTETILQDVYSTATPRGYGVVTLGPTPQTPTGSGQMFALSVGRARDQADYEKDMLKTFKTSKYTNIKLVSREVQLGYQLDSINTNPRSGDFIVEYRVWYNWTATTNTGQNIAFQRPSIAGSLYLHDAKLEKMNLFP